MVLCAINKSLEGLVYLLEPYFSFWELVISFFYNCFTFLNEINRWAWVFFVFLHAYWFLWSLVLNSSINHVLIWFFDIIWIAFVVPYLGVPFLICFVFCSNYISIWFLKVLCMHINYVYFMACLLSLIQYIGETPWNP